MELVALDVRSFVLTIVQANAKERVPGLANGVVVENAQEVVPDLASFQVLDKKK